MAKDYPEYKTIIITCIQEETPGVKTITVACENGDTIPYLSGQFLTLVFTHHGREERRSYSISSCPAIYEPLSFTIKRIDNGAYSRLLTDRAKVGDRLQTTGAGGLFTIPDNVGNFDQLFFFAAGIGITPIFSIIKTLLHDNSTCSIVLFYSNRSQEEVVFYNALNELREKYPDRLKIEYLYSTAFNLSRARLNKALIPLLIKEYAQTSMERMLFYLCGPFTYMRMAILTLEEMGVQEYQIKKENFNTNDRAVKMAQPADTDSHKAIIKQGTQSYEITVQYPYTILQAARNKGIVLPYSCETGRCGSCAALCTKGTVWMSYNEVLTDADIKKGMILTCVAHPLHGDIVIEV